MRQGCISLGYTRCAGCQQIVPHSARYLAVDEEHGVEVEHGTVEHYCVQCAIDKGYARHKEEKDGPVLTFFP